MDEKKTEAPEPETFQIDEARVLRIMLAQTSLERAQAQAQLAQTQKAQLEQELTALVTDGGRYAWDGNIDTSSTPYTAKRVAKQNA